MFLLDVVDILSTRLEDSKELAFKIDNFDDIGIHDLELVSFPANERPVPSMLTLSYRSTRLSVVKTSQTSTVKQGGSAFLRLCTNSRARCVLAFSPRCVSDPLSSDVTSVTAESATSMPAQTWRSCHSSLSGATSATISTRAGKVATSDPTDQARRTEWLAD